MGPNGYCSVSDQSDVSEYLDCISVRVTSELRCVVWCRDDLVCAEERNVHVDGGHSVIID